MDTGVTATITPTSSSNKILVIPAMAFLQYQQNSDHRMNTNVRIVRGSTAVETWGNDAGTLADVGIGTYSYDGNAVAHAGIWSTIYEDTPNTTSSTTYKIQISNINNKPQFGAQHGDKASTMTLLEVGVLMINIAQAIKALDDNIQFVVHGNPTNEAEYKANVKIYFWFR